MSTPSSEIGSRRLDLAGTRDFAVAGAGPARRAALVRLQPRLARRGLAVGDRWSADRGDRARRGRQHRPRRRGAAQRLRPRPAPLRALAPREGRSPRSPTASGTPSGMPGCGSTTASAPSPSAARSRRPTSPPPSACSTSRPIAGDEQLVAAARSTVAHDWRGNARKRLPAARRGRRRAPPAPGRPRAVHRARAQGGPRRPARHDRALGDGRGLARRPPARRRRRRARTPPRRPRRGARRHRPRARPPRPRGARRRRGRCSATTTPTTCSPRSRRPGGTSPTRSTARCAAPASRSAPAPCGSARAARR